MSRFYPPDSGPDPFIYRGNRSAAVARAIVDRFGAGDEIMGLADDYAMSVLDVERIVRWGIARLRTRRGLGDAQDADSRATETAGAIAAGEVDARDGGER